MKHVIRSIVIVSTLMVAAILTPKTQAYTMTAADINTAYTLSERLVDRLKQADWNQQTYQTIAQWLQRALNTQWLKENHQATLEETQNNITHLYEKSQNDDYFARMKSFRDKYNDNFQTPYDQPTALSTCFKHYPLVDEYARIVNKPTPLLLAMRYVESTCAMANPGNRDGLFQIINNDYEPGPITRAWLKSQLEDFVAFMDRKRNRYYSKNKNAPRDLSYTSATYDALQTFAALYNGIDLDAGFVRYPLLNGNPYYFLGNYNADYKARKDWLLVFYIKLSKLEADYFGK